MPWKDIEKVRRYNREYMRRVRKEHPIRMRRKNRERLRKFRKEHPEWVKKMNERFAGQQKAWKQKNASKLRTYYRNYERRSGRKANLTNEVRKLLGGKCECCGEREPEFLTVDHIKSDRAKIVKRGIKHGNWHYYTEIKRAFESKDMKKVASIKKKYRLACYNCNLSRRVNGKCPHERAKEFKALK